MNSNYLQLFLATCATGVISGQELPAKDTKQPNIIFIMVDDMGYGDLGFLFQNERSRINLRSEPWTRTPNLDIMAVQGVQLPNQYCAAPVSAPSRASFMTGRHQGHANVRDNQFDKSIDNNHTIATVLKAAGYSTAAFGKWGLQGQDKVEPDWPAHPLNRGFDYYLGYMRHGDGHEHYPKEGVYRGKKEVYENRNNIAENLDKCYTADLWTAAAKRWIIEQKQEQKSGKPFFIFLGYDTPHAVIELPTQAYPEGGGLKGGLQWLGQPGHMINTASGTVDSWIHPDYADATYDNDKDSSTPEVAWPDVYKRYATSTRRIDCAVGDLIQLLKDINIDKNTLIVFTSDNGPSKESYLKEDYEPDFFNGFGPFDGIKRDVLEGGVRVSALAYWPGHFHAGRVVKTPSSSYDWLPTFAQLAGVPAPAIADGVSLVPSLTGSGEQRESFVYVEYFEGGKTPEYDEFVPDHRGKKRNQMQMIRLQNLTGLRYNINSHEDNFEIFDVIKDPQQANNLAGNPGMEQVQQQMKDKVLQSRRPNASAKRPYDDELVPAVPTVKTTEGVEWKAYKGDFLWVPDVTTLTPTETGTTDRPNITVNNNADIKTLFFTGYIKIPEDGEYTFFLNTDRGAFLRIHDAALIDSDFGYEGGAEREGAIKLKAGLHPFRLYYTTKSGKKPLLDFQWSGPGISKQLVPVSAFNRDTKI
ncbi:MAG: sulfatase-like hydrolase/transferase [Bacteroidia bacterium]|nr:sulfatase-like hydrolase/transferase [Bacteroidia bacterium]